MEETVLKLQELLWKDGLDIMQLYLQHVLKVVINRRHNNRLDFDVNVLSSKLF